MDTLEALIREAEHPAKAPGARWSLAARCPRMSYYQVIGAPAAEPDEEASARMQRGQLHADWYRRAVLAEHYGAEHVVAEKPVAWPGGELHPDAYVETTRQAYEVKSRADSTVKEDDLTQLAGQVHYDSEAESGVLVLIDPVTLKADETTLVITDYWRERVESISTQVVEGLAAGKPPERVCARPHDAIGKFCAFASHCFRDWEPPAPVKLHYGADLARSLYAGLQEARVLRAQLRRIEEQLDLLRDELRSLIEPGIDHEAGGVRIRRSVSTPKLTWDRKLRAAFRAGSLSEGLQDALAPYEELHAGRETWTVQATKAFHDWERAAEEFGEVPF